EQYGYNEFGDRVWFRDRERNVTRWQYGDQPNNAGLVTKVIDARGGEDDNQYATRYEDDAARRLTATIDPNPQRPTFNYDKAGNVAKKEEQLLYPGQAGEATLATEYSYDLMNRLKRQDEAAEVAGLKRVTRWGYDAAGNLLWALTPLQYGDPDGGNDPKL